MDNGLFQGSGRNLKQSVIYQVSDLVGRVIGQQPDIALDGMSFHYKAKPNSRKGIQEIIGEYSEENLVIVKSLLLSTSNDVKLPLSFLMEMVAGRSEKVVFLDPDNNAKDGTTMLWAGIKVSPSLMSMTRSGVFMKELQALDDQAVKIKKALPETMTLPDIIETYKGVQDILKPVMPLGKSCNSICDELKDLVSESVDYLYAGLPLAVVTPNRVVEDYVLAAFADQVRGMGLSIGKLKPPGINSRGILEVCGKAPGIVAVRASSIAMASNVYEISHDIENMLHLLQGSNHKVIFTGRYSELQSVFHGGQGSTNDEFLPVIKTAPKTISIDNLLMFFLDIAANDRGGLSQKDKQVLHVRVSESLKEFNYSQQLRLLPAVAMREVNLYMSNKIHFISTDFRFSDHLINLHETFSGLDLKSSLERFLHVQMNYTEVLTDPHLPSYLKGELIAQDRAIEELVERLIEEVLTRPMREPLRLASQGTPATGKSRSCELLAKKLKIPYVNIDCASMPDYYSAAAQLLGSGRGIVGSNKAGKLEELAKHPYGAVVEISDLDHANPNVRSALADLFLQVLGSGNAQAASGAVFSCANLIMIFTINLPAGKDEELRKPGVGFNNYPTESDVCSDVEKEVKLMFSSAFLSRIGKPVLFNSLNGSAMELICERAVEQAVKTAGKRMNFTVKSLSIEAGTGQEILKTIKNISSYGARILIDQSRTKAAKAMLQFRRKNSKAKSGDLVVSSSKPGELTIKRKKGRTVS